MFYEREVRSFDDLMKAARVLDEDSGIRLIGESKGRRCLVFVTRAGLKYTMMTYSVKARTGTPETRLGATELDGVEALAEALWKVAPRRLRAYVY